MPGHFGPRMCRLDHMHTGDLSSGRLGPEKPAVALDFVVGIGIGVVRQGLARVELGLEPEPGVEPGPEPEAGAGLEVGPEVEAETGTEAEAEAEVETEAADGHGAGAGPGAGVGTEPEAGPEAAVEAEQDMAWGLEVHTEPQAAVPHKPRTQKPAVVVAVDGRKRLDPHIALPAPGRDTLPLQDQRDLVDRRRRGRPCTQAGHMQRDSSRMPLQAQVQLRVRTLVGRAHGSQDAGIGGPDSLIARRL